MITIFEEMIAAWPSKLVARSEVSVFSGGVLHPRTMANMDSQGRGPANRIQIGRKICYPIEDLVQWMQLRAEELGKQ